MYHEIVNVAAQDDIATGGVGLVVFLITLLIIGLFVAVVVGGLGSLIYLPYYLANQRGLNWPPFMLLVSAALLFLSPVIGWLVLMGVALCATPPWSGEAGQGAPPGSFNGPGRPPFGGGAPGSFWSASPGSYGYPPAENMTHPVPPPLPAQPSPNKWGMETAPQSPEDRRCLTCQTVVLETTSVYCCACGAKLPPAPSQEQGPP